MSAWMTSRVHRSALTQAAVVEQIIDPREASWLFNELTRCNRLALHHRYGDPHPDAFREEHREMCEAPLNPHVLIVNIGCWQYQCSEYDKFWNGDEPADQIMCDLRDRLLETVGLPPTPEGMKQWYETYRDHDTQPWGIDDWTQVIDVRAMSST